MCGVCTVREVEVSFKFKRISKHTQVTKYSDNIKIGYQLTLIQNIISSLAVRDLL